MPGCGKEELIRVAQELGFSVVRMGDTVREEAARRMLGTSDEAIGGFAHREREAHGYGVWAERTLPRVVGEHILIDGLRGSAELEAFRKALGEGLQVVAEHTRFAGPRGPGELGAFRRALGETPQVVAVPAPPGVRFARLRARNR